MPCSPNTLARICPDPISSYLTQPEHRQRAGLEGVPELRLDAADRYRDRRNLSGLVQGGFIRQSSTEGHGQSRGLELSCAFDLERGGHWLGPGIHYLQNDLSSQLITR